VSASSGEDIDEVEDEADPSNIPSKKTVQK